MVHRDRSPQAADPQRPVLVRPLGARPAALEGLGLCLLAVLHDVPGLEEDALGDLAPGRGAPQQELEVHAEVLELLALRVAHHRERLGIGLDGDPLLIPADRLGFLGQRGAQPRERPHRGRQLVGRLVVLVETHQISFVRVLWSEL